jgi:hypothetical protein
MTLVILPVISGRASSAAQGQAHIEQTQSAHVHVASSGSQQRLVPPQPEKPLQTQPPPAQ